MVGHKISWRFLAYFLAGRRDTKRFARRKLAALAIAMLGIATKFNNRAEHFGPATLKLRIPL